MTAHRQRAITRLLGVEELRMRATCSYRAPFPAYAAAVASIIVWFGCRVTSRLASIFLGIMTCCWCGTLGSRMHVSGLKPASFCTPLSLNPFRARPFLPRPPPLIDTPFRQQRVKSFLPILQPLVVVGIFFAIGIVFIPLGKWFMDESEEVRARGYYL